MFRVIFILTAAVFAAFPLWAATITIDNFTQSSDLLTAKEINPSQRHVTVTNDDGGTGVLGQYRDVSYGDWVGSTGQGTVQVSTTDQWISFGQNVGNAPAVLTYNGDGSGLGGGSGVDLTQNGTVRIFIRSVDWPGLQLSVRVSDGTNSYTTPVQTLPGFITNTNYNFDIKPAGRSILEDVREIQIFMSSVDDQDWRFMVISAIEDPIRVDLAAFEARRMTDGVSLCWRTESESNLAGYNIYRSATKDGEYTKINETMITAQGVAEAGFIYEFLDRSASDGVYWYKLEDVSLNGESSFHGPISVSSAAAVATRVIPQTYSLDQNYPNPFNPATTIVYRMPAAGQASLIVYDLHGKAVRTLFSGLQNAGEHVVQWDGCDEPGAVMPSGIYLCTFRGGNTVLHRKMTLMR
ncbi:MAG: T9SS type A sorting domain-containing protein [candidate division KSB1 bacterium]|nr:T9SS type A sorting domain-containing protein [candidate division KSB1 bacterium]